jgi:hypothetical protein
VFSVIFRVIRSFFFFLSDVCPPQSVMPLEDPIRAAMIITQDMLIWKRNAQTLEEQAFSFA